MPQKGDKRFLIDACELIHIFICRGVGGEEVQ
jgi:hypothetical protein